MSTFNYFQDFYAWATHSARLIREGRFSELDLEHIAEELESMGKNNQRELLSRLTVLLLHLLKWKVQPNLRSNSWRATIRHQRFELQDLLEQSPSLRHELDGRLEKAYERARIEAATETGLDESVFPADCEWRAGEVLSQDFLPG
jgi:hypothetical protein